MKRSSVRKYSLKKFRRFNRMFTCRRNRTFYICKWPLNLQGNEVLNCQYCVKNKWQCFTSNWVDFLCDYENQNLKLSSNILILSLIKIKYFWNILKYVSQFTAFLLFLVRNGRVFKSKRNQRQWNCD